MQVPFLPCVLHASPISHPLFDHSVKGTNYEAPHYAVSCTFPLLRPSYTLTTFSAHCYDVTANLINEALNPLRAKLLRLNLRRVF
jgi:hypothetical protein